MSSTPLNVATTWSGVLAEQHDEEGGPADEEGDQPAPLARSDAHPAELDAGLARLHAQSLPPVR